MTQQIAEYKKRYDAYLKNIAIELQGHISAHFSGSENIDRIIARAKDPDRFAEKAQRTDENGRPKYRSPLTEIQDQLGARIVVFYSDDVASVREVIMRYFQPSEQRELVPESEWEFGYFGFHFVLPLPRDVVPSEINPAEAPRFFELQVKTLFQHAWSEANHDLGYKAEKPPSPEQKRLLAYTAAQAWGADRVFNELHNELHNK
jgi:putative GTP pyrophosphokinase